MNKTFRVFVSGPFQDFYKERDKFQETDEQDSVKGLFQKLDDYCKSRGYQFQAVDLRWGISDEASYDHKTVEICLNEIKRSQKISPKPNFIVMLGNRYGWNPIPYKILKNEFEQIKKHISKEEDSKLLNKWFECDYNAIPPVYEFQPREKKYKQFKNWNPIEKQLRTILQVAVKKTSIKGYEKDKYFTSATEQEVVEGILKVPDAEDHVFSFFREINGIESDFKNLEAYVNIEDNENKEKSTFNEKIKNKISFFRKSKNMISSDEQENNSINEKISMDQDKQEQLSELKEKIRKNLPNKNIKEYHIDKTDMEEYHIDKTDRIDSNLDSYFDNLQKDIYDRLVCVIKKQIDKFEKETAESEKKIHEKFAKEKSKHFVGRKDELKEIEEYTNSNTSVPLAICGEPGTGKSSLLAKSSIELKKKYLDKLVITRIIGASPESTDIVSLLKSIMEEILEEYPQECERENLKKIEEKTHKDLERATINYSYILSQFFKFLTIPNEKKSLILFLDGINQLSETEKPQNLVWLPEKLGENTHIIISTIPGEIKHSFEEKFKDENNLKLLQTMKPEDGKKILYLWLKNAKRTLNSDQEKLILNKFNEYRYPLFLKLLFEESLQWRSYTSVNEKNIGNNTKEIINNLFDRLSLQSNHGEYLIRKTLSYIEASKYGLSEKELLELLSQKEIIQEYNTNIKSREAKEAGDVENLPHIILSRILADLNPYLSEISYNGIPLINFYHQQFSDVVQERYFTNEKKKREIHLDLANYFKNNLLLARTFDSKTINPRIVDELPWQYSYAEDYKQLIELITNMDFFQKLWNKDMFELNYFLSLIRNNLPTYSIKESFKKVVENNSQYNSYILIILGLFLTHGGLVYEAMKLFQEVEKRSRKNNDKEYLAVSLNNQGILLPQNSDSLDNAMELFKESEQLYRESNPKRVPESLVNQARTLLKQRKIDEATRIFKEIEETCNGSKNLHENNALQICLKDHGWMFEKSGEYDKAMELYRKSEIINRELHNRGGLSHSLYGIASVYFYKNDMYNAVKILKELEKLCREIGSEDILKECLSLKAKIIEINGGFDKGNEIRAEIKELMKKFEYENRQK